MSPYPTVSRFPLARSRDCNATTCVPCLCMCVCLCVCAPPLPFQGPQYSILKCVRTCLQSKSAPRRSTTNAKRAHLFLSAVDPGLYHQRHDNLAVSLRCLRFLEHVCTITFRRPHVWQRLFSCMLLPEGTLLRSHDAEHISSFIACI